MPELRWTYLHQRLAGWEYEVGPDASLFPSIPVLHNDYINTPQFRALLYGALDAMQVPRIDLLVIGLPVHLHETHSARLEDLLIGAHEIRPGMTVFIPLGTGAVAPTDPSARAKLARAMPRGHE